MGLMKKLTSVVVTAGLLLGLVGTAAAAYPDGVAAAAGRMHDLGLVNGKVQGSSDLQLNDPITRAELVTIIVRAFGKANDAKFLKGAAAFPDTASHWASGEIALAKNMIEANGFSMGMPDGTFAPDAKLTTAQAVAFVMKFLGAPRDASQAWPNDYLNGAVAAGLMSADDKAALEAVANNDANRGLAFYLADEAFYSYKMADGKTVYTEFVKPTAPTVTLDEVAPTTKATATVSGSVSSDATAVYVGSMANEVTVTAGKFSADVDLTMGDNNISVMATDLAGNTTTKTLTITRTVGTAASIDAPATLTVKAGDTVDLAAAVKDADGNTISDAVLTATGDAGTLADGKFTAATKAGDYTLTLTSGDLTATVAVTVTAADMASIAVTPATVNLAAGAVQKFAAAGVDQYGNSVDLSNVTWSASAGVIDQSGNFAGTGAGNITITATSGESSGTATATVYGVPAAVKVTTSGNLTAGTNSSVTVTAQVVDANGNPVPNATNTINFSSSNTTVATITPGTVAAQNGVATATLSTSSASIAGTTILTAAATGLTNGSLSVTTASQVLTSIKVYSNVSNMSAAANSGAIIYAKALDQNGNAMKLTSTITVNLTSTNPQVAAFNGVSNIVIPAGSSSASNSNLRATTLPGSVSVNATIATSGFTNLPITNTVSITTGTVGSANKVSIDPVSTANVGTGSSDYVSVVVRVLDYAGNQVTSDTGTLLTVVEADGNVKFNTATSSFDPATAGTLTSASQADNLGQATFYVRSTVSGTFTINASAANLTEATADVTFNPGQATKLTAKRALPGTNRFQTATIANDGVSQATLTFAVQDQYGNTVTSSNAAVTLERVAGSNTTTVMPATTTVNAVNGVGTFQVGSTNVVTAGDTFRATAVGLTTSGIQTVVTQNTGAASRLISAANQDPTKVGLVSQGFQKSAGSAFTVYVGVADTNSAIVSTDSGRAISLAIVGGTGTIDNPTATTQNGYAAFTVTGTVSGSLTLQATSAGLSSITLPTYTIGQNTPSQLEVVLSPSSLATGNSSSSTITVYSEDANGNEVNAVAATTVTVSIPVDTFGVLSGGVAGTTTQRTVTMAAGTSSASFTFTASGTAGSVDVTATAPGYKAATATYTTQAVGAPAALAFSSVSSKIVGDAVTDYDPNTAGVQTVAVDADDTRFDASAQGVTVKLVDASGYQTTGIAPRTITITVDKAITYTTGALIANGRTAPDFTTVPAGGSFVLTTGTSGSAKFYALSAAATTVNYTATSAGVTAATVSGTFTPDQATGVSITPTPSAIAADGAALSLLQVAVTDAFGNTVTTYSGTMNLSIASGNDYATLVNSSVTLTSGQGSAYLQSKAVTPNLVGAGGTVNVVASLAGTTWTNNTNVSVGIRASIAGTTVPSVTSPLRFVAGNTTAQLVNTVSGAAGYSLNPGDTLTFSQDGNAFTATFNAGPATVKGTAAVANFDFSAMSAANRTVSITAGGVSDAIIIDASNFGSAASLLANIQAKIAASALLNGKVNVAIGTGADAGKLVFTSAANGTAASLDVIATVANAAQSFLPTATAPQAGTGNVANIAAVTPTEVAAVINAANAATAAVYSANYVSLVSATAGVAGTIQVTGGSANSVLGFSTTAVTGLAANNVIRISIDGGSTYRVITLGAANYTVVGTLVTDLNTQVGLDGTLNGKVQFYATSAGAVGLRSVNAGSANTVKIDTAANGSTMNAALGMVDGASAAGL